MRLRLVILLALIAPLVMAQSILVPRGFKPVARGIYLAAGATPMHDVTVESVRYCWYANDLKLNLSIYVSSYAAPLEFFTMDVDTNEFIQQTITDIVGSGGIEHAARHCR